MSERGLGRIPPPDRDKDFRFLLSPPRLEAAQIEHRYWHSLAAPKPFNQGNTSQCVAYAWARLAVLAPKVNKAPPFQEIYDRAQQLDEWEGEGYDGTSVRAGAKAMRERGLLDTFSWAFDHQTVLDYVLTTGPVVLGTEWLDGMFETDSKGFVNLTGAVRGGHAYCIDGATRRGGYYRCAQSWGHWGRNNSGWFHLRFGDADKLIKGMNWQGEACTATEKRA